MTNPYGITLDRAWTEWAAEYGVSPTVAAALFLISVHRPAHEVAAKLTACEFKQVIDIVRRWPRPLLAARLPPSKPRNTPRSASSPRALRPMGRPVGPARDQGQR